MREKSRLTSWDYAIRVSVFIGLVIIVLIVQAPLSLLVVGHPSELMQVMVSVSYILGFIISILIAVFAYRHYVNPERKPITGQDVKLIILAYISFFIIEIGLAMLNTALYHQNSTANNEIIQSMVSHSRLLLILMGFTTVFCSPILEELVFRGFLIGAFFPKKAKLAAIIVSGVLFSLPHQENLNVISFLTYAILGGILAYLYVKTENIKVSIGLHFLNNLIAMSLMFTQL